jgi:hypothetical protein
MEWKVADNCSNDRIEDNVISGLKDWLQTSGAHCKVSLDLCDPYFWLTVEQRKAMEGSVGNYGCAGPTGATGPCGPRGPIGLTGAMGSIGPGMQEAERKIADPKRVLVKIEFSVTNEHAEQLKTYQLSLTKNHLGDTYPTWTMYKMQKELPYTCGVYKKPGFNEAFAAIKALKTTLTEESFARQPTRWDSDSEGWDMDLVNLELFHGWTNCMKTFRSWTSVYSGDTLVRMCLLAPDVNTNLEYITTLLSAYIPGKVPI